jgi:peptidase E
MTRQIIALGGGGFSMEPENPLLDRYILDQTGKPRPKVCFLPHAVDDAVRYVRNFYDAFTRLDCLGFLEGSFCPHYEGEPMRRPTYHRLIASGEIRPGIALDDGAAAHFIDGQFARAVSSRPNAKGYRLSRGEDGEACEEPVLTQYLGKGELHE